MSEDFNKKQLQDAFSCSLLDAIIRRRSRRFPVGCALPKEAVCPHVSRNPPIPLSETELAILCYSAAGITGAITTEPLAEEGNSILSWVGHATPNPCNVPTTRLFFTNDNGTFLYDPKVKTDIKPVEIETESDREKILTSFGESCTKILDHRVQMHAEHLHKMITWNTNQPGTTVFIPVVDHSEEYLNWVSMVLNEEYGYQLFDDIKGRDCGLKKYIDNGDLKGPPVPLSSFESFVWSGIILAPAYLMMEHIHLVAEALGLGSVMFGGYTGEVMLGVTPQSKGLGFRWVKDKASRANAVGLDGVFEAYCPPFYSNMDDAVDAFFEKKFGSCSLFGVDYTGLLPFQPGQWKTKIPNYRIPSKKQVEIVKAFINYVYDTYGKIPAGMNTMTIPVWLQVHHVEVEFYEKYYAKGIVTEAQRQHLRLWHT
jgi:hypothetical protein